MAPDIKATLARAAAIPQALVDEARALLDKNPQAWSQSLLYATATQKKIKDTERRVSEFRKRPFSVGQNLLMQNLF